MELLNHLLNTSLIIQYLFIIINALYDTYISLRAFAAINDKDIINKVWRIVFSYYFHRSSGFSCIFGIISVESTDEHLFLVKCTQNSLK